MSFLNNILFGIFLMKIYRKGLNEAQNLAVKNIIQGSSQPHPFILLGLAGNFYQKQRIYAFSFGHKYSKKYF